MWKHPKYYKEIKKQNNLTNKVNHDKGLDNENIQNKVSGNGDRSDGNATIRKRTNSGRSRKLNSRISIT